MPKYYVTTGDFSDIIDSPNREAAIIVGIKRMLQKHKDPSPVIAISERGFLSRDSVTTPTIPIMKLLDIDLPSDKVLAKHIAKCFGTVPSKMNQKELNWLLYGDQQ